MAEGKTVQEGDHVVFKREDKCKVFQIFAKRQIFFEKARIRGDQLVGQTYGTLFEVQQGKLVPVVPELPDVTETATADTVSGKDNRNLVASEENQKLSQEQIMKMKEQGLTGQEIVEKLVEQSETFKTKTEFSQEKYIKKKKKKHMVEFRVLKPCTSLLLETYKQTPGKICNLRADSLSQLLCYSSVMSGSTVAVVESCQGLVLGAVMERLGGNGRVLHLYPGNDMNRQNVKFFNFDQAHMEMLYEFPLCKLAALENGTLFSDASEDIQKSGDAMDVAESAQTTETETSMKKEKMQETEKCKSSDTENKSERAGKCIKRDDARQISDAGDDGAGDSENGEDADDVTDGAKKRKGKQQRQRNSAESRAEREAKRLEKVQKLKETAKVLQEKNLDSLIIATKFDPLPLLLRLLPYVAPSRWVVVFSQHKEPLVECYTQVKEKGLGIQLRLAESWYREYQVLPARTHPLMQMSGTGGYLLSFIRVESSS